DFRGYGKLVSAASTARRSGCGRSVGCQGGKRVSATSVVAGTISYGYGNLVSAASTARRSGCVRSVGCQGGKAQTIPGKFQIKADRVDDLDSGYACSNVTALRFPTAMGKLVSAASTARRSGCGRSVGCQGGKAPISYGYGQARERGIDCKAVRLCAASAAKAEKRVGATSVVAGTISYGYGVARERGVDCKADSSWAQRRLPRRKSANYSKVKFQIKADRVDDLDSGYACSNVTALRFPTAMGKLKLFQGKFQIKADRVDDLDSGYACSNVTALRFPTAMGNLAEKRVGATSVVAGSKDRANGLRLLHWPRVETIPGKFQIKADRVDDLDSGYACSNVTALRFPTAMGKLVSAAATARRSGCVRSVGCQGGKAPISYGYGQLVSAASTARRTGVRSVGCQGGKRVGATSVVAGTISYGYAEARERGIDCKADRLWAQRRLPRRKSALLHWPRVETIPGKFQIKADRGMTWTPAMRAAMLQHSDFLRLWASSDFLRLWGSSDFLRLWEARERGIDCKAKLFQGKFQIKADRVDDLDSGYACSNVTALRFPTAMGKLVSAAATARRTARGRSVGCQGGKARRRDKLFQGKFQIKADRVDDLDSGYACSNVTALRFPTAMGKLVSAAAAARRTACGRSVGCQGGKAPISYGYGVARERGGDGKADSSWAQRRLPRRKSALLHWPRVETIPGKFQIKADPISDGYGVAPISDGYGQAPISDGYGVARERGGDGKADSSDFRRLWVARERGGDGKADSSWAQPISDGYGVARERGGDGKADSSWAQPISDGYGVARERGGDGKADSSWAQPISDGYGVARERGGDGKADSSWAQPISDGYGVARERGGDGKADSSWAQPISDGYGVARERGGDGKADSSWAQPISDGYGVARERGGDGKADSSWAQPISDGYGVARERGGDGKADSSWAQPISDGYGVARERGGDGKADSSWAQPISDGYGVARERGGDGKADSSWAQPISDGYGVARERGGDGKADSSWAQRQLPRRKSALLHWPRVETIPGKFQIKADRGDDLDSGYACSNVTALEYH
ncbi:hypothetical protein GN244_ATG20919, partial [Phytophthora infestans]